MLALLNRIRCWSVQRAIGLRLRGLVPPGNIGLVAFAALIPVLCACQSAPVTYYSPPVVTPPEELATLVGSKVVNRNIFFADEITYVRAIDGLPVDGGWKNFDTPIQLSPGEHAVQIGFAQGSGCAEAGFQLSVESQRSYFARAEKLGRESIFRKENLSIWIEDSEGIRITDKAVVRFEFCGGGFGLITV